MIVKLLTEHHLEFLSLKGGCRGSSESTLVKMSNSWKSHALAHIIILTISDRQYKDHQYPITISYCNGCIAYVEKHVQNVNGMV